MCTAGGNSGLAPIHLNLPLRSRFHETTQCVSLSFKDNDKQSSMLGNTPDPLHNGHFSSNRLFAFVATTGSIDSTRPAHLSCTSKSEDLVSFGVSHTIFWPGKIKAVDDPECEQV
eukprot:TRINITY_DN10988_c0_g1_i1.p1 TRINITY_DN10988_c0_g1~~TRINITY_DN10988_c0_g1_i1.p1  ORF type:complete len:115 (+),score=5.70 TRINITY_DN10988_c0_g1_i1:21-365(+)